MYDLILYDTSNFVDFPMGGQLTSIRSFLKYVAHDRKEFAKRMLLVGVTCRAEEVGQMGWVSIDGVDFAFLPVLFRDPDLAAVKTSLRLEYVKALLRERKRLPSGKASLHYIHTPEAFIAVKLICPHAKTAVFSHGSFFNMAQGFRFFRENKLIQFGFHQFLILLLRMADMLFALDENTAQVYRKYNKQVFCVENAIVLPEETPDRTTCHDPIKLLFVGRLSKVKGIDGMIAAVEQMPDPVHLTIVGDGEERDAIKTMIAGKNLEKRVLLAGGCMPEAVAEYYRSSDILVMNSSVEGKPMAILEAMSYGLPVVTTPVGGIPEMVDGTGAAEMTDGVPEQIVQKVVLIAENYSRYASCALEAAKKYDYRRVNEEIFRNLCRYICF